MLMMVMIVVMMVVMMMVMMMMMTKSCVWDPKLATVGGDELFSGGWTFSLTKTGATALLPFEELRRTSSYLTTIII